MFTVPEYKNVKKKKKVSVCAQLYSTLCDFMDCCPPGSSAHGIFQARMERMARIPTPGDLPNQGIEPGSPVSDSLSRVPPGKPLPHKIYNRLLYISVFSLNVKN